MSVITQHATCFSLFMIKYQISFTEWTEYLFS